MSMSRLLFLVLVGIAYLFHAANVRAADLQYQSVPLSEVVQDLSPYLDRSVSVAPSLATTPVTWSGVVDNQFSAGAALRAIAMRQGFHLEEGNHGYRFVDPGLAPVRSEPSGSFMDRLVTESKPDCSISTYDLAHVPPSALVEPLSRFLAATGADCQTVESVGKSLLVASPEGDASLRDLITSLDVPRDQVWIQAQIFELSETDFRELGFSAGRAQGGSVIGGVGVASLSQTLSTGLSFGLLDDGQRRLVFQAIEETGNSRLLSMPSVVSLSGTRADLSVGQDVPVVTGAFNLEQDQEPFQTIERRSIGVQFLVTPTVLQSSVSLELEVESSSVNDSIAASDIVFNERRISTAVVMRPGQTLLVGGLVSSSSSETRAGVPLLSDIPWLGKLFSRRTNDAESRVLVVAITANPISV